LPTHRFFDSADSIDFDSAWHQSRYDKAGPGGTGKDYVNCPLDEEQFEAFIDALLTGDKPSSRSWRIRRPISGVAYRSR
jgi:methylenetetrahydrofolate--tRNA-(uracil-5-)-methyltransferase